MTNQWWDGRLTEPSKAPTREMVDLAPWSPPPPHAAELPPVPPEPAEAEADNDKSTNRAHGLAVKVVGGVAGALIIGALTLGAASGNDAEEAAESSTSAAAETEGGPPPAGAGVPEGDLPAAGVGLQGEQGPEGATAPQAPPATVTLTAEPSGKGRVGAVMKVSIRNDTDKPLTVMATLMQGDGRPAVVGEGTLAPGSRTIEPGQGAKGTVEFSMGAAPSQVVLLDLSGNVVAASN